MGVGKVVGPSGPPTAPSRAPLLRFLGLSFREEAQLNPRNRFLPRKGERVLWLDLSDPLPPCGGDTRLRPVRALIAVERGDPSATLMHRTASGLRGCQRTATDGGAKLYRWFECPVAGTGVLLRRRDRGFGRSPGMSGAFHSECPTAAEFQSRPDHALRASPVELL